MALREHDAVLFDMDGTLIDDSESYREAIRLAAEIALDQPVTHEQVREVKRVPGFNNDWDTTWAVVHWLREGEIRLPSEDEQESEEYAVLRAIFQTLYLGSDAWREQSGDDAPFRWDEPLMMRETRLIRKHTLDRLSGFRLGIATARPRAEALLAVRQHDLDRYFGEQNVVGLEDAEDEKPAPDPLLELARRLDVHRAIYVGDTINDAMAALDAGMPFIHVGLEPLADPAVEQQVAYRLGSVNDLADLFAPVVDLGAER